jgi:hypothetical protein
MFESNKKSVVIGTIILLCELAVLVVLIYFGYHLYAG